MTPHKLAIDLDTQTETAEFHEWLAENEVIERPDWLRDVPPGSLPDDLFDDDLA